MMNRKIVSAFLAVGLLLSVAGCGKYADEGKKNETAAGSSSSGGSTSTPSTAGNTGTNTSTGSSGTTNNSSGSGATNTGGQSQQGQQQTTTTEKANLSGLAPGATAKVGPVSVTLKQTQVVTTAAGLPPGYVHLLTEVSVTNEGADPYTINITDHFKLETPEGKKSPYNVGATANQNPRLQGTLLQGKSATGWIGYLSKSVPGNYKYMFIHPDYGQATWEFAIQ